MRLLIPCLLLSLVLPAVAQQPPTRWGATLALGTESGLGYSLPYTAFGGAVEHEFHSRIEIQGSGDYSPTHKVITNDGHQEHIGGRGLVWITKRVAITAGDSEGWLSTSQFTKYANSPSIGMADRVWLGGFPSRIYISYLVPTGKRPTDGSLQSNRTQGISTVIEAQGYGRVRLITTFDILTFLDQSGAAPGLRHWEGTVVVTLRVGTKQNMDILY